MTPTSISITLKQHYKLRGIKLATDKSVYQAILTNESTISDSVESLKAAIDLADNFEQIDPQITIILNALIEVKNWANENITRIDKEAVLNDFLNSLKTLMSEYSAKIEVVDVTSGAGYGEEYGVGEATSAGIKIEVTKDGITSNRIFEKAVVTSDDI